MINKNSDREPEKISLIVLTFNNERTINLVLSKIQAQDYMDWTEVIIIDNKSNDLTYEICKQYPFKVIQNSKNIGIAPAINIGITLANYPILVILSGDVIPNDTSWLRELVAPLNQENVVASCSLQYPPSNQYLCYWEKLFWSRIVPHYALNLKSDAYKKEIVIHLGLFDEKRFKFGGEDADISIRIRKAGYIIAASRSSVVHDHKYNNQGCLFLLLKASFNYGFMSGIIRRKYLLLIPRTYMFPDNKITYYDNLYLLFVFIGCFIPYIRLFTISVFLLVSMIGIKNVVNSVGIIKSIPYPFFRIVCMIFNLIGYVLGIIKGKH